MQTECMGFSLGEIQLDVRKMPYRCNNYMKEKIARFLYSETDINNNKCYLSLWYIEKGKLVLAFGRYILMNGFCNATTRSAQ